MLQRLLIASLLAAAVFACSGGGSSCVDTLCTAGETSCQADGHLHGTCAFDGRSWELKPCPAGTTCSGGSCVPTVCTPDRRLCSGEEAWQACDGLGASLGAATACDAETGCMHGVCVSSPCFAGQTACNGTLRLSCSTAGGGWVAEECPTGQHCTEAEGAAAECRPDACVPYARQCVGGAGYEACAADGSGWGDPVACAGDEACFNGLCQPRLCQAATPEPDVEGDDAADAPGDVGGDTADSLPPLDVGGHDQQEELPPLEVPDTGSVAINGNPVNFTMSLSGKYVANEERVIVSMNELVNTALYQLEIHVLPVAEYTVGEWSHTDPSEVACEVRLNDGTGEPGEGPDSYKYKATEYTVALDQFDAVGGRIKGSFSGVLTSKDGAETLTLTGGRFDVKRKN